MKTPILTALTLLAATGVASGQTIIDLGVLPGSPAHDRSRFSSMSADGSVVFGTSDYSASVLKAFRWTASAGLQEIPSVRATDQFFPGGCNDAGTMLGGSINPAQVNVYGFGWTLAGGTFDFPSNGGFTPVYCSGATRWGNYYFGTARQPSGAMHGFRKAPSGAFQSLGTLGANSFNSSAFAASQDGAVIVGSCDLSGTSHATRWTPSTGQQLLGVIQGASVTEARCTNRYGDVVGGYALMNAGGHLPFRWTQSTGLVVLGNPSGQASTFINGMSDDGRLLLSSGWSGPNPQFVYAAHFWRPATGWTHLQNFLSSIGMNLSGWSLESAGAISQDLTVIAGHGRHNGQARAFRISGIPCWAAPEVIEGSPRRLNLCGWQDLNLTVIGGGEHVISVYYQWYFNGVPLSDGIQPSGAVAYGAQSSNLTMTGINPGNSGSYHCVVFNQCGSSVAAPTNVTVGAAPTLFSLPAPLEVCPGGSGSLSVTAFSSIPEWYQWEYFDGFSWSPLSNGPLADFFAGMYMNVSGAQSPTLSLSSVSLGNYEPMQFRCTIGNDCGVLAPFGTETSVSHAQPLWLFGQSEDLTTCSQGPATFTATFGGTNPQHQWETYSYFFNNWVALGNGIYTDPSNGITFSAAGTTSPNLTITNAYLGNHDGPLLYRCVAIGACNAVVTDEFQHTVCVGDFNCDGQVDGDDIIDFFALWDNNDPAADLNYDNSIDGDDVILMFSGWDAGC